jgi:hypothetical protein
MSQLISSFPIGTIFYQSGYGIPTHIATKGCTYIDVNAGIEYINRDGIVNWVPFLDSGSTVTGYYTTTGITSSQTISWDKTYWGVSANTNVNLVLPSVVGKEGYYLIIKDESGFCDTYRIRLTPTSGLINKNNYVDMNIKYMSLTCIVRDGNWYSI